MRKNIPLSLPTGQTVNQAVSLENGRYTIALTFVAGVVSVTGTSIEEVRQDAVKLLRSLPTHQNVPDFAIIAAASVLTNLENLLDFGTVKVVEDEPVTGFGIFEGAPMVTGQTPVAQGVSDKVESGMPAELLNALGALGFQVVDISSLNAFNEEETLPFFPASLAKS